MKSIERPGRITENGKLSVVNQESFLEWIKANKNKEIIVSIELRRNKRSGFQNNYYWGVVVPLVQNAINELGNEFTRMETHEFLKARFNYKEVEFIEGHYIDVPVSTTRLDTQGFNEYIEKIQRFGSEMLGIYIPDPEKK